jgi:hypothetical protein
MTAESHLATIGRHHGRAVESTGPSELFLLAPMSGWLAWNRRQRI